MSYTNSCNTLKDYEPSVNMITNSSSFITVNYTLISVKANEHATIYQIINWLVDNKSHNL